MFVRWCGHAGKTRAWPRTHRPSVRDVAAATKSLTKAGASQRGGPPFKRRAAYEQQCGSYSSGRGRSTARAVIGAIATGLTSWAIGDRWSGWLVGTHAVIGLSLLVLVPAKARGSVATGFRRRRSTRWLSAAFGVLVLVTAVLGVLHATGLWFGVGPWTALWTHALFGFALLPLFIWHLVTRPVRPRPADLDRRAALPRASSWARPQPSTAPKSRSPPRSACRAGAGARPGRMKSPPTTPYACRQ